MRIIPLQQKSPTRTALAILCALLPAATTSADEPAAAHFYQAPKPIPAGAVTQDWPRFLGPSHNASSGETKLLHQWGPDGPKRVWEMEKGVGFAGPSIVGDRLVVFQRLGDREAMECVQAETGKHLWTYSYVAPYHDRYGTGDGPRTSAVIADGRVFTYGVTGQLHCVDLEKGKEIWKHDCGTEFDLQENFFGHGSTPLVVGHRLFVNLGGAGDLCAAAFDTATGRILWKAKHEWGASYASPVPAKIHDKECVLIFAGGESRPPTGGLLCIDAANGKVLSATPHRAEIAESVNASSPTVAGNQVFVTESYGSGGDLIEIKPDFSAQVNWHADRFGAYFMTPIVHDGCIIGSDGQSSQQAEIVCYEIASGKELWRNDLGGKFGRSSLLAVDGSFLCLGEFGDLAWLDLSRQGVEIKARAKLFNAPDTWTLPAVSHGLLYISQNARSADRKSPRVICYDLRGE